MLPLLTTSTSSPLVIASSIIPLIFLLLHSFFPSSKKSGISVSHLLHWQSLLSFTFLHLSILLFTLFNPHNIPSSVLSTLYSINSLSFVLSITFCTSSSPYFLSFHPPWLILCPLPIHPFIYPSFPWLLVFFFFTSSLVPLSLTSLHRLPPRTDRHWQQHLNWDETCFIVCPQSKVTITQLRESSHLITNDIKHPNMLQDC